MAFNLLLKFTVLKYPNIHSGKRGSGEKRRLKKEEEI
jgi:hypothetical protein